MTGNLAEALKTLITEALPGLFAGDSPPVQLTISSDLFEVDPQSGDAATGEPRPDDRTDDLSFDPNNPDGPYTLTQPPYPGPKRVRLTTELGDRIPLREDEIIWDEADSRVFALKPRPNRELSEVTGVQVLYSVTAIFARINAVQTLTLQLQSSNADTLQRATALVVAVIELNRQHLVGELQESLLFSIVRGYRRWLNRNRISR